MELVHEVQMTSLVDAFEDQIRVIALEIKKGQPSTMHDDGDIKGSSEHGDGDIKGDLTMLVSKFASLIRVVLSRCGS
jgi:hypothetical protein